MEIVPKIKNKVSFFGRLFILLCYLCLRVESANLQYCRRYFDVRFISELNFLVGAKILFFISKLSHKTYNFNENNSVRDRGGILL